MTSTDRLPEDPHLAAFRESYADLFGFVPPLPQAKFEFSSDVAPEALLLAEQARAHAFRNNVFDEKTTQLMVFGMLVVLGANAARWHAIAARRQGASWKELHQMVELASVILALGPMNKGSALLNELRANEAKGTGGG